MVIENNLFKWRTLNQVHVQEYFFSKYHATRVADDALTWQVIVLAKALRWVCMRLVHLASHVPTTSPSLSRPAHLILLTQCFPLLLPISLSSSPFPQRSRHSLAGAAMEVGDNEKKRGARSAATPSSSCSQRRSTTAPNPTGDDDDMCGVPTPPPPPFLSLHLHLFFSNSSGLRREGARWRQIG